MGIVRDNPERVRPDHQSAALSQPDLGGSCIDLLARATRLRYHEFWPCTLSILDSEVIDSPRLHSPKQVTAAYLLALAVAHDGRFVTFGQSIALAAVPGASKQHLAIL
jgi:predicted nucleic acid-binding protein